ncbi:RNase adapter RapZ [Streptomyces sp. NPDC005329]|uniref:RapZ C-terminal domain-containing protein n=1 Tax=Streptomyces sp. NPDC005329 TaxID=3157034 RepID=UPI0033A6D097
MFQPFTTEQEAPLHPIRLISFGYLHLPTGPDGQRVPPAADRIEDVRDWLRDPAAARDILDLDGLNPRVQDVVLNTPGARELLANLADYANLPAGPRRIAVGCAGGKHRACGLTELLARALRDRGREVEVEHLHRHLPRVLKAPDNGTAHPTAKQEATR